MPLLSKSRTLNQYSILVLFVLSSSESKYQTKSSNPILSACPLLNFLGIPENILSTAFLERECPSYLKLFYKQFLLAEFLLID